MSRERLGILGAAVLVALSGFVVATRFAITNDVTQFLPARPEEDVAAISQAVARGPLARTLVLSVEAPTQEAALEASRRLEARLEADASLALSDVGGGPPEGVDRALYELYVPRALGFVADTPEGARARFSPAGLAGAASRLRDGLTGPMSTGLARLAPRDPFLVLPALFERAQAGQTSGIVVRDGRFASPDAPRAFLFVETESSAFDADAQAPLLRALEAHRAAVAQALDVPLTLRRAGAHPFSVRMAAAIRGDIQRISIGSTLLLILGLGWAFRRPRLLALATVPLATGVLVGLAATLWVFGRVQGVTLAFGATLLGVAIDYVVHLYAHHEYGGERHPGTETLREIRPALRTGAITTLAGFVGLGASSLGGLKEVALFAAAGVGAALLITEVVVAPMLTPAPDENAERAPSRLAGALLARARALPRPLLGLAPAFAIVIVAVGLPRMQTRDSFLEMAELDAALVEEDAAVRAQIGGFEQSRMVVAYGDTEDEALARNAAVARALDAARAADALDGYRSIAALLPAPSTQRDVAAAIRGTDAPCDALHAGFASAGFREGVFAPFCETLTGDAPAPLTYADLRDSPAAPLVRPFRFEVGGRVAFVTFLQGARDPDGIADALADRDGVVFLRQADLLRAAQAAYRGETMRLVGIGLVVVLLLLLVRYRALGPALVAYAPGALAALATLGALALLGRPVDLVVLTALLFVVSMGVDYGVFLVDAARSDAHSDALRATTLGVSLAGLSTLGGFGLLSLSSFPLLSTLGLAAVLGLGFALTLGLSGALWLVGRREDTLE